MSRLLRRLCAIATPVGVESRPGLTLRPILTEFLGSQYDSGPRYSASTMRFCRISELALWAEFGNPASFATFSTVRRMIRTAEKLGTLCHQQQAPPSGCSR